MKHHPVTLIDADDRETRVATHFFDCAARMAVGRVWRDTDEALYTDSHAVGLRAATGAALPGDGRRVAIPFKRVKTICCACHRELETKERRAMKRRTRTLMAIVLACLWTSLSLAKTNAQTAVTSRSGRITAMNCEAEYLPIQTNWWSPSRDGSVQRSLADVRRPRSVREDGKTTWSGRVSMAPGKAYRFEQTLDEADGTITLDVRVTADADIATEGVYFWLDVPIKLFAGGDCRFSGGKRREAAVLPRRNRPSGTSHAAPLTGWSLPHRMIGCDWNWHWIVRCR